MMVIALKLRPPFSVSSRSQDSNMHASPVPADPSRDYMGPSDHSVVATDRPLLAFIFSIIIKEEYKK